MHFHDRPIVTGHLTITKRDVQTKEETVLFDDHNIIVSGMGATISNIMTRPDCLPTNITCAGTYTSKPKNYTEGGGGDTKFESCLDEEKDGVEEFNLSARDATGSSPLGGRGEMTPDLQEFCISAPYKIKYIQLGTEGTASREVESTYLLGNSLEREQYGVNPSHINFVELPIGNGGRSNPEETLATLTDQVTFSDNILVSYLVLDETACNGVSLNEAGLFTRDPYLKGQGSILPHMVAYRAFTPIKKDNSFELLIRWAIHLGLDCNFVS